MCVCVCVSCWVCELCKIPRIFLLSSPMSSLPWSAHTDWSSPVHTPSPTHTHMHIVAQNKVGLESYIWYSVIFQFLSRHGIDSLRLLLLLYKNTDTTACVCVCACTLAVLPYFGDSGSFSIYSGLQVPSLTHLSIHLPALHTQSMKLLLHTTHTHTQTRHTVTTHSFATTVLTLYVLSICRALAARTLSLSSS